MKVLFVFILITWTVTVTSQEYELPPLDTPLPPPIEEYCGDREKFSDPVVSYRISEYCEIIDVQMIGEYQYGVAQVKKEVMGMVKKDVVRRYQSGNFVLFNEVTLELHRALDQPAKLVCTIDMMGKKVMDAKIVRQKLTDENKMQSYNEPVNVENNQLPNLGIFTYTKEIRYTINTCPEITR
jgi:hypothetical protein